jgi:hypothetical protein
LHRAGEQITKISELQQPEQARVKSANLADSQTGVPVPPPRERQVLARFARGEETPYVLDHAEVMSLLRPAAPPDRDQQFQALADRERLAQELRRLAATRTKISSETKGNGLSSGARCSAR